MNALGFGPVVDIHYTADPAVFERGHTFWGGAVLLPVAQEAATLAGYKLVKIVQDYDSPFSPKGAF